MTLQITDIKLPERAASAILSILESNNMPARLPTNDFQDSYNCWGFTAYYCEWEDTAKWLENFRMETYLEDHTRPISKDHAKAGDIAIFRRGKYLTHTAVLLPGGDVVYHKPGGMALCIDTLENASCQYGTVTYARVEKKRRKNLTIPRSVLL